MATTLEDQTLTPQQELFCKYYASDVEFFGNGVKSYMKAYPDSTYNAAKDSASKFLTNPDILSRINELLELGVLNDEFVDKQLAFLISQNTEFPTKIAAIKEYNALKKRIVQRLEIDPVAKNLEDKAKDFFDDPNNRPENLPDDSEETAPAPTETP